MTISKSSLLGKVIEGGYCIGCGACASIENSPVEIKLNNYSQYQAVFKAIDVGLDVTERLEKVCPFSNSTFNEEVLGGKLYGGIKNIHYNDKIGYYKSLYAGYVVDRNFRKDGSSGGMGSWILSYLLENKIVDRVVHVKESKSGSVLFSYQISSTTEEVIRGAKSRYYPIELSKVISELKKEQGVKYAIIGLPCYIKAVRLLMEQDTELKTAIKFCIGLVCGHLKSGRFAEMFAWQCGIKPSELGNIDFRVKLEGSGANKYGISVTRKRNPQETIISPPVSELYGSNWGHGFFKYNACDYCDDVLAETADLTIGDAWLPQYLGDSKGTNVMIVRNEVLSQIVKEAHKGGILHLDSISAKEIITSQSSGIFHRREGLAYRLYLKDKQGCWRPEKRVKAGVFVNNKIQNRQNIRLELTKHSHIAFNKAIVDDNFDIFVHEMSPILDEYKKYYRKTFSERFESKVKKILNKIFKIRSKI